MSTFVGEAHGTAPSFVLGGPQTTVVTFPAGIADGDLMFAFFAGLTGGSAKPQDWTGGIPATGWTTLGAAQFNNVADNGAASVLCAVKTYSAAADGASVTFSVSAGGSGTVSERVYGMVVYRSTTSLPTHLGFVAGVDGAANDSTMSLSETKSAETNTLGAASQLLVSAWYVCNGTPRFASPVTVGAYPPAGTKRLEVTNGLLSGGVDSMMYVFDEPWASAADLPSRGPATWTGTLNLQLFEVACRPYNVGDTSVAVSTQEQDHWAWTTGNASQYDSFAATYDDIHATYDNPESTDAWGDPR